jgi:hypothetical protein
LEGHNQNTAFSSNLFGRKSITANSQNFSVLLPPKAATLAQGRREVVTIGDMKIFHPR